MDQWIFSGSDPTYAAEVLQERKATPTANRPRLLQTAAMAFAIMVTGVASPVEVGGPGSATISSTPVGSVSSASAASTEREVISPVVNDVAYDPVDTWTRALAILGEDASKVVAQAAENLEAWVKQPSDGTVTVFPSDEDEA